jgi:hypothetical protein
MGIRADSRESSVGQLAGSQCHATLVKTPPGWIAASTTGNCQGDHLTVYLASNSAYTSQTATATSSGSELHLPCGYWQADFYSGTVRSVISHSRSGKSKGSHVLIADRRGDHTCSPPVTTTTTTVPSTTTTVAKKSKTTQPQTGSSSGDGGGHAKATHATAAHAGTGALAFTGAPVAGEAGFAMSIALVGAVLVRLAGQRRHRALSRRLALARQAGSVRL